jgi:alanine dehydrogenase
MQKAAPALNGAKSAISSGRRPYFIPAAATRDVLAWDEMIARLRAAYSVPHGHKSSPPRVVARGDSTWIRSLTGVPPGSRFMGSKLFGMSRDRHVNYLITLIDQETCAVAALVDANHVTAFRTGATSAVAVQRLAKAGPAVLSVLGSGSEADSHVRAIARVRPITALRVYSPTAARREEFAARMERELKITATAAASADAAVEGSDIVVAAARSHGEKPILFGRQLRPGMLVVSIGSTLPEQREIDPSVVDACDLIVCDMVEEVVEETGDMIAAKAAGVPFEHKLLSLNDLLLGKADDKVRQARLPMFKSIGAAVQDIAIAELAMEKAVERGLAIELPMEFLTKKV